MAKQAIRSDQVKRALANRHTDDLFLTEVKTGRTWDNRELLKFDALAMKRSWANPCLSGYEVKVSRNDFMQDTKWPGYMAYCHKFSFVCPKGLISKDELPDEVGLIYYYPDTGALRAERSAKHRMVDIPPELYMYMLMSRTEPDRHPFFSSRREMLEAYVSDKNDRRSLGNEVGTKLVNEIRELRDKLRDMEWQSNRTKEDAALVARVRKILDDHGIKLYQWNDWEDELRQQMAGGVNPKMVRLLEKITENADDLRLLLDPAKASGE